jgi:hypothetical protein
MNIFLDGIKFKENDIIGMRKHALKEISKPFKRCPCCKDTNTWSDYTKRMFCPCGAYWELPKTNDVAIDFYIKSHSMYESGIYVYTPLGKWGEY